MQMSDYMSLNEAGEHDEDHSVLVHVAEPSRAKWSHIDNLDSFFTKMYIYHQSHGFLCMFLKRATNLLKYIFVVMLSLYMWHGVNYRIMFNEEQPSHNGTKTTFIDAVLPFSVMISNCTLVTWLLVIVAIIAWLMKAIYSSFVLFQYWEIKQFYNNALKINDADLNNMTWHEVQTRIRAVQVEQQICIHKRDLTELDIYHRILRQTNYMVAMMNKKILPPRVKLPFIGEQVFWTDALITNIKFILFWPPFSPFISPWHLHGDYKKANMRHELAKKLERQIAIMAVFNLVLMPAIFIWQLLYTVLNYLALIRKEPKALFVREWSKYGQVFFRHFNELEHELNARLTRARRPANRYLQSFRSQLYSIACENISFYAGSMLGVLIIMSMINEGVLSLDHALLTITVLTIVVSAFTNADQDETTSEDLEDLLTKVLFHTHYLPADWSGQAHTHRIRKEFEQLFSLVGMNIFIETIVSPILTPYVLYFQIQPRALDIIDFFRNFTVEVVGVGDVCSFAQMDVKKNGNPNWHQKPPPAYTSTTGTGNNKDNNDSPPSSPPAGTAAAPSPPSLPSPPHTNQVNQGEDGKVELSLLHFTTTNPSWVPPENVQDFVSHVQNTTNNMVSSISAHPMPEQSGPMSIEQSILIQSRYQDLTTSIASCRPTSRLGDSVNDKESSPQQASNLSRPNWQIGDPVSSYQNQPPHYLQQQQQQQHQDTVPELSMYTSGNWRNRAGQNLLGMSRVEGPSLSSYRDMMLNTAFMHGINTSVHGTLGRPAGASGGLGARLRSQPQQQQAAAKETTPLLADNQ